MEPGEPVLSSALARRLARIGLKIEEVFSGEPQDIEWLTKGGRVYVVQARHYPE